MLSKISYLLLLYTLLISLSSADISSLNSARSYYRNSENNKEIAVKLENISKNKTEPIFTAYYGVSQCILASFKFNPYTKLNMLNEGLNIMNKAVTKDSTDIEIRMIRLSVESNIPSFISFKSHIAKDKAYIKKHFDSKHPMADVMKDFIK